VAALDHSITAVVLPSGMPEYSIVLHSQSRNQPIDITFSDWRQRSWVFDIGNKLADAGDCQYLAVTMAANNEDVSA
jgi:hypothetical protein